MKNNNLKELFNNIKLFLHAATDVSSKSKALLIKESHNEMDDFILLCFGDLLGIPIPTTYYSLELLPLISEDLDGWQNRMISRLYVWQEKWSDYGFDA
ncbi:MULTISPECIES: hypothetical protein [unclassified Sedimentibacter]|uniref:hypothetical protein n=1 Tax=unclassified Sedimentibacter TaxID=2649220 RepID=UPI0027DFFEAB|nr:hypothetical protein [Sedimentibacter sp. MB35-C1]WMJ76823.1 hypothetical protein RBQ61_14775 [Sedimentibacter sp. MB35-C1]